MIYILLNIVFASSFPLCVKWVQNKRRDVITVGAINYIVAGLVAAIFFFRDGVPISWDTGWTGATNGVCYFVAFFFLIVAIPHSGAANSSAVTNLSILMPIGFGILVLHEQPGTLSVVGIAMACSSLLLVGRRVPSKGEPKPQAGLLGFLVLASLFLIAGGARVAQEFFKHRCSAEDNAGYLLVGFAVTAVASGVLLVLRNKPVDRFCLAAGTLLGLANLLQTYFTLKALQRLPGYIVFPATSAGGLAFVTFIAVSFLRERLRPLNYIGLAIAIGSLALLHQSS